jgi:hypothetical protein
MGFSSFKSYGSRVAIPKIIPTTAITMTTNDLNIISWYDPANVLFSSNNIVNGWTDSTGINNLSILQNPNGISGITKIADNVISFTNQSYLRTNSTLTTEVYGFITNIDASTVNNDQPFQQLFSVCNDDSGVRYIFPKGSGVPGGGANGGAGDLNTDGDTMYNGISVQTNNVVNNNSVATGNTIFHSKFGANRNGNIKCITLGNYSPTFSRGFIGNIGHFFILNMSFTVEQRQYIEGYLGYIYGTQNKLPSLHPYYSANNSIIMIIVAS